MGVDSSVSEEVLVVVELDEELVLSDWVLGSTCSAL